MKLIAITGLLCLGALASAQDVHFDYDRSANFSAYKTYQWVDPKSGSATNQLMDQNIKRAIDAQLAMKGLQRVESGGDLQVAYQAAIDQEKQFDGWGAGPRWFGPGRVTTSTIDVGKLVVDLFDPAKKQLVWRGARGEDARHQEGSREELQEPREGHGQAVQELPARKREELGASMRRKSIHTLAYFAVMRVGARRPTTRRRRAHRDLRWVRGRHDEAGERFNRATLNGWNSFHNWLPWSRLGITADFAGYYGTSSTVSVSPVERSPAQLHGRPAGSPTSQRAL